MRRQVDDEEQKKNHELRQNIESFWEFFPKSHQAMFAVNGLVRFDSIVLIDGEGDLRHKFPHIYVDFQGDKGPFAVFLQYLELGEHYHRSLDGLKRSEKFPKKFPNPRFGKIYRDKTIELDERARHFLERGASQVITIYDCDDKFQFLNQGDVIGVEQTKDHDGDLVLIKITNKRQELAKDLFNILPALLILIANIILGVVSVIVFARKKDVQPILAIEDFWGGLLIGFLVGYTGKTFIEKLLPTDGG